MTKPRRKADPRWRARAACRGSDPDLFFDEATVDEARAVCLTQCEVSVECLASAVLTGEGGVRGGLEAPDRRFLIYLLRGDARFAHLDEDGPAHPAEVKRAVRGPREQREGRREIVADVMGDGDRLPWGEGARLARELGVTEATLSNDVTRIRERRRTG